MSPAVAETPTLIPIAKNFYCRVNEDGNTLYKMHRVRGEVPVNRRRLNRKLRRMKRALNLAYSATNDRQYKRIRRKIRFFSSIVKECSTIPTPVPMRPNPDAESCYAELAEEEYSLHPSESIRVLLDEKTLRCGSAELVVKQSVLPESGQLEWSNGGDGIIPLIQYSAGPLIGNFYSEFVVCSSETEHCSKPLQVHFIVESRQLGFDRAPLEQYLNEVKSAHENYRELFRDQLSILLEIAPYQIQHNVSDTLATCSLPNSRKLYFEKMQLHFDAMQEFAATLSSGDSDRFVALYNLLLDDETGDWSNETRVFASENNFTLPSIMMINGFFDDAAVLTDDELANLYNRIYTIVGDKVEDYFSALAHNIESYHSEIPADLRHVKIMFKIFLEEVNRRIPIYKNFYFSDAPSPIEPGGSWFGELGFREIIALTRWWFIRNGELRELSSIARDLCSLHYDNPERIAYLDDGWHESSPNPDVLLRDVLIATHEECPGLVLGIYSYLPDGGWRPAFYAAGSDIHTGWRDNALRRAEILGPHVDVLYPAAYNFWSPEQDPTNQLWERMALNQTVLAREIGELYNRQPVISFLWNKFHGNGATNGVPNNNRAGQHVPGEQWLSQLERYLDLGVDGITIYGYGEVWQPNFYNLTDGNLTWFEATVQTMNDIYEPICE